MPSDSELKEFIDGYLAAFNAGDAAGVASFYSQDAVIMPPVGPTEIVGREAIKAFYDETFRRIRPHLSDYSFQSRIDGGLLVVRESWNVALAGSDGVLTHQSGRGMWVARKESAEGWLTFWSLAKFESPPPSEG